MRSYSKYLLVKYTSTSMYQYKYTLEQNHTYTHIYTYVYLISEILLEIGYFIFQHFSTEF